MQARITGIVWIGSKMVLILASSFSVKGNAKSRLFTFVKLN